MDRIEVVSRLTDGSSPLGRFGRKPAFETETVRVGETCVDAGVTSPWHHHGRRTLYGFVVVGELILEFGPHGSESVRPTTGEFFRIPPGLVHRDRNPTAGETAIQNVMIGPGPATIDVSGPEE